MVTYWLVGEEPWRNRRGGKITPAESETPGPAAPQPSAEVANQEIPRLLDNVPSSEHDSVDSTASTWLLADCPTLKEDDHSKRFDSLLRPNKTILENHVEDRNGVINTHVNGIHKSLIRHQSVKDSSCKTCQVQTSDNRRQRLPTTRYSSAPIIAAVSPYHRDSSPSIPLRTTSPQSCA